MYAVIKNGGKQYKVKEGDIVCFDKMDKNPKEKVVFEEVLYVGDKIGYPLVENAFVEGEVINEGKEKRSLSLKKEEEKTLK